MKEQSFIFNESVYKDFLCIQKFWGTENAWDYLEAVINFGLYGDEPTKYNKLWTYGDLQDTFNQITADKEKFKKKVKRND
jgi:hypothetical protein